MNVKWLRKILIYLRARPFLSEGKNKKTQMLSGGNFLFYFILKMLSENLSASYSYILYIELHIYLYTYIDMYTYTSLYMYRDAQRC